MTIAAVLGAVVVALVAWILLFVRGRGDIWNATWAVAAVLIAYSVVALGVVGQLDEVIGPVGPVEVTAGVGVGVAWLALTHVGHAVLSRLFPPFIDQVEDLYRLGADDPPSRVVGPVVAMAVAEELLFRGVVHGLAGYAAGVIVYTAVQGVERKWALAVAALISGVVWGGLFEITGGLLAPVVAHVIWTLGLTLLWPLGGRDVPDGGIEPIRSEPRSPSKGSHA